MSGKNSGAHTNKLVMLGGHGDLTQVEEGAPLYRFAWKAGRGPLKRMSQMVMSMWSRIRAQIEEKGTGGRDRRVR